MFSSQLQFMSAHEYLKALVSPVTMVKKIDVPCWSYREAALIALLAEISL
jgi:hypothetical protein